MRRILELGVGLLATAAALGVTRLAGSASPGEPEPGVAAAPPPAPETATNPLRTASYTLRARLDATAHRIEGSGSVTFRNTSSTPVSELYFHLYLNAFKHEKSLFLRSQFGEGRGGARPNDWGYIDVRRCFARELGTELWPAREPGNPEDPDDETDVRVPLPRPLAPGDTLTLELDFSAKLPGVVLRTGYAGSFHFAGQWFPKLARLEPDGSFAHFSFHPQAEFYADYGDYDVTLDVPADAVVGATGSLVERRASGDRRSERYRAEAVHDFAWTAWPGFEERTALIDGVRVRFLFPAGRAANAEASRAALAFALPRASRLYGRYPYPTLTVVHPPEAAAEAGGMEYPTLITTGGAWYAGRLGDRAVESVSVHELLHQWFYGLVATNEARWPFLDEGFTSYAEFRLLDDGWGPGSAFSGFGLELSATALGRAFAAGRAEDAAVSSPAAGFPGFNSLASLVYARTAAILETLARVYGRERLERALGTYAARGRFGHPTPADFARAVREELGPDAERVLKLALDERGRVDYLVRDVESVREHAPAGIFDRDGGRETLSAPPQSPERYRGRAVVLRHGTLELPVDIELVDTRGRRSREHWDGRGPFRVVNFRGDAPLAFVLVDPERRVVLDDDLLNNAAAARPSLPWRTLERASYFGELALLLFGP